MKNSLIILLLFSTLLQSQVKDIKRFSFGKEIITQDDIQLSGAARLSDLFQLINSASISTIDGYRVELNINSITPDWKQNWILLVDNQKINLDFPYIKNINLLPIGIMEIDFVEIFTAPGIINGEFNETGIIHIHTLPAAERFSIHASLASANETGDPGPYTYTNTEAPNIDQIGPYYWTSINFGGEKLGLKLGLKHHLQIYTDPKINNRFSTYPWEYKQLRMMGASLKIDAKFLGGSHSLFITRTETGDPVLFPGYGSDILFFKPFGMEIPVESKFTHAGLNGNFILSDETRINYNVKFSSSLLDWTMPSFDNLFDWNINNYDGYLEIVNGKSAHSTKLGLGINHIKMITHYKLESEAITLIRINGQTQGFKGEKLDNILFGGVVFDGTSTALKAGTNMVYYPNKDVNINMSFSYSSRLPEEDYDLWYWTSKGYNFMNDYSMSYTIDDEIKSSKQILAEVDFMFNAGENFSIMLGGFYRKYFDTYIENRQVYYNPDSITFNPVTRLSVAEEGNVAGFRTQFEHNITSTLKQKMYYRFVPHFSGTDTFSGCQQSFPQHTLKYSVDYRPVSSFGMMCIFTYLSETYWPDYEGISKNSGGQYNQTVDNNLLLDFSIQKTFLENGIRVNLALKNILGGFVMYHPLGGMFDMTLFMQVELRLDSI